MFSVPFEECPSTRTVDMELTAGRVELSRGAAVRWLKGVLSAVGHASDDIDGIQYDGIGGIKNRRGGLLVYYFCSP